MPPTYGIPTNTYACGKMITANRDNDIHYRLHKKKCAACKTALANGAKEVVYERHPSLHYDTRDKKMEAKITEDTSRIAGQLATHDVGSTDVRIEAYESRHNEALATRVAQRISTLALFDDCEIKLTMG